MDATVLAALVGLVGIALGGGVQVVQNFFMRRAEAASVLSALAAEVEALTRLVEHRRYLQALMNEVDGCRALIAAGRAEEQVPGPQMRMHGNYFALYDQLAAKIGLLKPYQADRIVRFYMLAKAGAESLITPEIIAPMPAQNRLELLENDIQIIHTLLLLGHEIAGFRQVAAPTASLGPPTADATNAPPRVELPRA